MTGVSTDPMVLRASCGRISGLILELRASMTRDAPLREQVPLVLAVSEQYDLVGMHDAARRFQRYADLLAALQRRQDERVARHRRRGRWPFRR